MTLTEYPNIEQRSEEWYAQRRGLVTASVVGKLVTVGPPDATTVPCPTCPAKTGPCLSLSRKEPTPIKTLHDTRLALAATLPPVYSVAKNDTSRGIVNTLIAERVTGWTDEGPITSDMWRGIEHEPFAVDAYAANYAPVTTTGFMVRREKGWTLGYSPDGKVGTDGLIEVKCPRSKTHLATILADEVPPYHMPQLQAGLLVSGRKWIDFVSFCGGMPLFVKRVRRDNAWFKAIREAAKAFETTAAEMVAAYETATESMPATERVPDPYSVELKLA